MPSMVQAPPMQSMSSMDDEDKVVCGVKTGGAIVTAAGCLCIGLGLAKSLWPCIVGGALVSAAGAAILFNVCGKDD